MKITLFGKGCEAILCENLAESGTERSEMARLNPPYLSRAIPNGLVSLLPAFGM